MFKLKGREKQIPFIIILTLLGILGAYLYLKIGVTHLTTSFMCIPIGVAVFFAWNFIFLKKRDVHHGILKVLFCFVFCFFQIAGRYIDLYQADFSWKKAGIKTLLLGVAIYPIICVIVYYFDNYKYDKEKAESDNSQKYLIICFLITVAVWILGYLAAFPGMYGIDAPNWFREFSEADTPISSQWSPAISGLFYLFISVGKNITGSYESGFALLTAIQMAFALYGIWRIYRFLQKKFSSKSIVAATLFYCLIPSHMILSISSAQEAPFMVCFSMSALHLLNMATDPDEYWEKKSRPIAFIIWTFAGCICRNNCIYAVMFMVPFVFFYFKKYRIRKWICLGIIIAISYIYSGPVLDAFGVWKGTSEREKLSIPLQQIAKVYNYSPEKMTDDEKAVLESYIPKGSLEQYKKEPQQSDAQKNMMDIDKYLEDSSTLHNLIIKVGMKAPKQYFLAALEQDLGMIYLDKKYPEQRMYHFYLDYNQAVEWGDDRNIIQRHSLFPAYNDLLLWIYGDSIGQHGTDDIPMALTNIPVLSQLSRVSTYFWVLMFILAYHIKRGRTKSFVFLAFYVGYSITILLSPLIIYRYYGAVIYSAPLMVSILFLPWDSRRKGHRAGRRLSIF